MSLFHLPSHRPYRLLDATTNLSRRLTQLINGRRQFLSAVQIVEKIPVFTTYRLEMQCGNSSARLEIYSWKFLPNCCQQTVAPYRLNDCSSRREINTLQLGWCCVQRNGARVNCEQLWASHTELCGVSLHDPRIGG